MKLVTDDTFRTKINAPDYHPYLVEDITCDVVIVGAGVTAHSVAISLQKENIDTVLIDKNIIGYESTRASLIKNIYQGKHSKLNELFNME